MMKYRLRKLHGKRREGYAEGECDSIYIRSGDVSWISVRNGVLLITTDDEHWVRPQVVVDIMRKKPSDIPEGQPNSNIKSKRD